MVVRKTVVINGSFLTGYRILNQDKLTSRLVRKCILKIREDCINQLTKLLRKVSTSAVATPYCFHFTELPPLLPQL